MHKIILMMLLAVVSSSAMAEWVVYVKNEDSIMYVNPSTISRTGHIVKMWHMDDYISSQTVGGFTYLSTKTQSEFDCQEGSLRTLYFSWYSGSVGSGNVVYLDDTKGNWQPYIPETTGEIMWKIACGKQQLPATNKSKLSDWIKVKVGADIKSTLYENLLPIGRKGNTITAWGLSDYETAQDFLGFKYKSFKTTYEFDCKGKRFRVLSFSYYSESMGEGNVWTINLSAGEIGQLLVAEGIEKSILEYSCKKRR